MKFSVKHLFRCFFCLILFQFHGFSQSRILHGFVKDAATGKSIPFPHLIVDGSLEFLGDMEGNFSITIPSTSQKILAKAYTYLESELNLESEDSAKLYMYYAHPFTFQTITTPNAKKIISSIRMKRTDIDPRKEKNFEYSSYNKFVITTNHISSLKLHLKNLISIFGTRRMSYFGLDHHILLMESSSRRIYKNFYNQNEHVNSSKISGINKPPALSLVSGFEPLSIFEPFLRIGSGKFISPLAGRPGKRYIFFLQDSIKTKERTFYVVKFNPRSLRNKDLLQGILYISMDPVGVVGFQVWPAFDRESTFSLLQKAELLPSGRWFPGEIKTVYQRSRLGALKIPIEASSKTYIFNIEKLAKKDSLHFNEVIFDFQKDSLLQEKEFPPRLRQERLSTKDQNTYSFYNEAGSLNAIDKYLTFGQKLLAGRIPFGRVDLVFRKAITVNDFEGLRLGFGLQTTEQLSRRNQFGGYFGYGYGDKKWKYGLNYVYKPDESKSFTFNYQDDLSEPGMHPFVFEKLQYNTEQLRLIRIPRFDRLQVFEFGYNQMLARNLSSRISFETGRRTFLYDYIYTPKQKLEGLGVSEMKLGINWNPGAQFIRFGNEKYSLQSKFPNFWIQFSQGLTGLKKESYRYSRLEAKMQWNRRILGLGDFGIQVVGGIMTRGVPYSLLFSSRASYREITFLSYNSFETMRYNEFTHDQYFNVFIAHKFSRMQISTLPYRPYFTLLHNMGWGRVSNPELHKTVDVKSMPFGFYESGLFLNDLFIVPLLGVNLGIGGGLFLRYGPYSLDGYLDNIAIKFSTSVTL